MSAVILKAHYDGKQIVLDDPFDLEVNTPLAVTVLSREAPEIEAERAEWAGLGAEALGRAYGPDEPEYTLADIKHEGR
jgi:hypothetical protein